MNSYEPSLHENRLNWYYLAPGVWRLLFIGYAWLFICFIVDWKVDSAGGMLVGVSIAAEIVFNRSALQHTIDCTRKDQNYVVIIQDGLFQFNINRENTFERVTVREQGVADKSIYINTNTGVTLFMPDVRSCLYQLAIKEETAHYLGPFDTSGNIIGSEGWAYHLTSKRIKNSINAVIATSAIVGTLIWSYV